MIADYGYGGKKCWTSWLSISFSRSRGWLSVSPMIVNPNGKHFGISIFQNRRKVSFSLEMGKKTPLNMISWTISSENLSKFGWTLILLRGDLSLSKHDFYSSMMWNNSLVRIANRAFFYKH